MKKLLAVLSALIITASAAACSLFDEEDSSKPETASSVIDTTGMSDEQIAELALEDFFGAAKDSSKRDAYVREYVDFFVSCDIASGMITAGDDEALAREDREASIRDILSEQSVNLSSAKTPVDVTVSSLSNRKMDGGVTSLTAEFSIAGAGLQGEAYLLSYDGKIMTMAITSIY